MNNIYHYLTACLVIGLLSACNNQTSEDTPASTESKSAGITIKKDQFTSSKFKLGEIEQRTFSKTLNATGSLHIPKKSMASISTLISGTIGAINLHEGQWVNKGQRLFTITNPELINLQEEYLIVSGQLAYLKEVSDREVELSKERLSTKRDLLKAKSELLTTQARYGALQKKLNLYGINTDNINTSALVSSLAVIAPISGYISQLKVLQGMYIEPNQSALTISDISNLQLELSVLEKDAVLLMKDQKITFTLQGIVNKQYSATVYLINKSINENHLINVHCHIDGDKKTLVPGMYANAKIVIADYMAQALPEDAIVKMGEKNYVLSLQNEKQEVMAFDKTAIKIGAQQDGYIELDEPADSSLQYLTKGAFFLID